MSNNHVLWLLTNVEPNCVPWVFCNIKGGKYFPRLAIERCPSDKLHLLKLDLNSLSSKLRLLIFTRVQVDCFLDLTEDLPLTPHEFKLICRRCKTLGNIGDLFPWSLILEMEDIVLDVLRPRDLVDYCYYFNSDLSTSKQIYILNKVKRKDLFQICTVLLPLTPPVINVLYTRINSFKRSPLWYFNIHPEDPVVKLLNLIEPKTPHYHINRLKKTSTLLPEK